MEIPQRMIQWGTYPLFLPLIASSVLHFFVVTFFNCGFIDSRQNCFFTCFIAKSFQAGDPSLPFSSFQPFRAIILYFSKHLFSDNFRGPIDFNKIEIWSSNFANSWCVPFSTISPCPRQLSDRHSHCTEAMSHHYYSFPLKNSCKLFMIFNSL